MRLFGFPIPEFTAYFVGFFETLGGFLILIGLASRLAAITQQLPWL